MKFNELFSTRLIASLSIFALLLNLFTPATVVMAEGSGEAPEILSVKYGQGMTGWPGNPPSFWGFEVDGVITDDEVVITQKIYLRKF